VQQHVSCPRAPSAFHHHVPCCAQEYYLEGAFRNVHTRLRTHAESVAFFGGGAREGSTIDAIFQRVQAHARSVADVRCCLRPPSPFSEP
jgi:ABC-type uncharacterized transport system fused permease/ATPase subunit